MIPRPVSANKRVPTVNTPLKVPVDEALNDTVNAALVPGAMLSGSDAAPVSENPVPDTDNAETVTAEMVVCGLVMLNVNEFAVVPPAMLCPRLMGVAGWAVSRTPVEST